MNTDRTNAAQTNDSSLAVTAQANHADLPASPTRVEHAPRQIRMYSRTTDHGTAMAEATLCQTHYQEPFITYANVVANDADDVGDQQWRETTSNEEIACVECDITSSWTPQE